MHKGSGSLSKLIANIRPSAKRKGRCPLKARTNKAQKSHWSSVFA